MASAETSMLLPLLLLPSLVLNDGTKRLRVNILIDLPGGIHPPRNNPAGAARQRVRNLGFFAFAISRRHLARPAPETKPLELTIPHELRERPTLSMDYCDKHLVPTFLFYFT